MVDRHRFRARIDGELWWEFSRHRSEKTASKIATKIRKKGYHARVQKTSSGHVYVFVPKGDLEKIR